LSKNTVRATIETSDDEEDFSFEIVKEELWRAVRLLEEHGCGSEVPSAATSLDSKALRVKMARMFLTSEIPSMGRASTSSAVVPSARARASPCSKIFARLQATVVLAQLRRTTSWVMTRCACYRHLCRLK
jgi:hypothetical protein